MAFVADIGWSLAPILAQVEHGDSGASIDLTAIVIAVVIGIPTLIVAVLAYRDRWPKKRIEYLVLPRYDLLPGAVPESVKVMHMGNVVDEPTLTNVRIVNSGDAAITESDFSQPLELKLTGVSDIALAACTAVRPAGLQPKVDAVGDVVSIAPLLLNSEDLIQLQVLTAGKPDGIRLEGRITDLKIERIRELPYPPGSGEEGEMLGFDAVVWWIFAPALGVVVGAAVALDSSNSVFARILAVVATIVLVFWLYPLRVNQLIRRRRLWRPDEPPAPARWRRFWGMR